MLTQLLTCLGPITSINSCTKHHRTTGFMNYKVRPTQKVTGLTCPHILKMTRDLTMSFSFTMLHWTTMVRLQTTWACNPTWFAQFSGYTVCVHLQLHKVSLSCDWGLIRYLLNSPICCLFCLWAALAHFWHTDWHTLLCTVLNCIQAYGGPLTTCVCHKNYEVWVKFILGYTHPPNIFLQRYI